MGRPGTSDVSEPLTRRRLADDDEKMMKDEETVECISTNDAVAAGHVFKNPQEGTRGRSRLTKAGSVTGARDR